MMTKTEQDHHEHDEARLEKLKEKLDIIKNKEHTEAANISQRQQNTESASLGLRAGAELIASIAAGALLGFWLDQWLETKPLFLIILLLLGILTGFVNVWRTINGMGHQIGYKDTDSSKKTSNQNK